MLQVAERIHTDPKIVEAVEADNFDVMGAPVYARGHIRHYAELVGEAAAELIALYSDSSKVAQPDVARIVKPPSTGDSNKLVAAALLMIGVFAVAGAVWWISALKAKKPQLSETHIVGEEPSPPLASEQEAPPPDASQAPAPASSPTNSSDRGASLGQVAAQARSETSGASGGAHGRAGSDGGPGRTGSAAGQGRSGEAGSPNVASGAGAQGHSGTPAAGAGTATPEAAAAHPKNQAQVVLRYSSDSWTEVYDANGTRLFYDVGTANTAQTIVGTPPLRIVLGNASGVAVQVNGHNVPISQLALLDGSVQ
ncbi:MAG: helix-turn-helix domain-containing protein, partial [Acetobacteraceae bacterium]|nr:helix-turn-helix domain-containing protein [Acetobacteraceae bacterium]